MSDIMNPDGSTLTEVEFTDEITDWDNLPTDEIVQHLLSYICPAGLPHTGPDALEGHDHGHTVCFFIGLAIKRIHNLVAENEHLRATFMLAATPVLGVRSCPAHVGMNEPCPICRGYIAAGL